MGATAAPPLVTSLPLRWTAPNDKGVAIDRCALRGSGWPRLTPQPYAQDALALALTCGLSRACATLP